MPDSRTDLRIGELVRVRDEVWRVADVRPHRDCDRMRLAGAGLGNRGVERTLLHPFDRPARLVRRVRPRRVSRGQALRAVAGAAATSVPWGSLAAAAEARLDLLPYQLEPALTMVRDGATRVLIADEVGLGKTIQAGLILSELVARGEVMRALVLTPAGLRQQWADELRHRFGVEATVADAAFLRQAAALVPRGVNPWAAGGVHIASFDFVKRAPVLRGLESLLWDLLIVDEAHAAAGESDRHVAVGGLARRARRVVLLTATPHGGDDRAFEALCDLGRLGDDETGPVVMFRRTRAAVGRPIGRRARVLRIAATPAEWRMHRLIERYTRAVWREASQRGDRDALLAMLVLRKRALSSAGSLAASIDRRFAALEGLGEDEASQLALPFDPDGETEREDEEPSRVLAAPGLTDRAQERGWLRELSTSARAASGCESKLRALVRLLGRAREPVIVFTEYRDTLVRIAASLAGAGRTAILHGGLSRPERAAAERAFNTGAVRLLVATDVAAEGLNLQARCRAVVNFELPWNPARLEQRAGRVDRIGQTRPVHALSLIARDTAEHLVLANLAARVARESAALGPHAGSAPPLPELAVAALVMGNAPRADETSGPEESTDSVRRPARPPFLRAPSLETEARVEALRLNDVRRLARVARLARVDAVADDPQAAALVAVSRARGRRRLRGRDGRLPNGLLLIFRGSLVDAGGRPIDSLLASFFVRLAHASGATADRPRLVVERYLAAAGDEGAREAAARLSSRLALVGPPHRAAIASLSQREVLLREEIGRPLARLLIQPGLFDRRAVRRAEREREIAGAQAEEAETRLAMLKSAEPLAAGEVDLIAALVLT
jgi:superfamily II DNA or RNA helicase